MLRISHDVVSRALTGMLFERKSTRLSLYIYIFRANGIKKGACATLSPSVTQIIAIVMIPFFYFSVARPRRSSRLPNMLHHTIYRKRKVGGGVPSISNQALLLLFYAFAHTHTCTVQPQT